MIILGKTLIIMILYKIIIYFLPLTLTSNPRCKLY